MSKINAISQALEGRTVIIWGARMTGLGALRQCRSVGMEPRAFIDSDTAFQGKTVSNLPVYSLAEFLANAHRFSNPAILIAVSLKESEIRTQLAASSVTTIPVISFQDEASPYYTVDILGSCNLKCASCPHSIEEHAVPKGSMSLDTFQQVLDKISIEAPDLSHISLYSWGEPLMHPKIADIVEYVHTKNVAVALSSNLSIRFEGRIEELMQRSPDYLKVSVSGYYPTAYNNSHQGGDVNLVKSNLYRLRYFLDKYKTHTLVDINYHLYRDNCGENLEMFRRLADELGFMLSETYALVMPLERVMNHLDGKSDFQTDALNENMLVSIREGISASKKRRLPEGACPFRENQVNINADLTVPVCCTVFHRNDTIVVKNYLESSFEEVRAAKSKVLICNQCTQRALPEYNMGLNREEWKAFAGQKIITDSGGRTTSKQ